MNKQALWEDTLIEMKKGPPKKLIDLEEGDLILSYHKGFKTDTVITIREYCDSCESYRLVNEDGALLYCSGDAQFFFLKKGKRRLHFKELRRMDPEIEDLIIERAATCSMFKEHTNCKQRSLSPVDFRKGRSINAKLYTLITKKGYNFFANGYLVVNQQFLKEKQE